MYSCLGAPTRVSLELFAIITTRKSRHCHHLMLKRKKTTHCTPDDNIGSTNHGARPFRGRICIFPRWNESWRGTTVYAERFCWLSISWTEDDFSKRKHPRFAGQQIGAKVILQERVSGPWRDGLGLSCQNKELGCAQDNYELLN